MRTVSGAEATLLTQAHVNHYVRVYVKNASGTDKLLTSLGGTDWVDQVSWDGETVDRQIATATISLRRDVQGGPSLAPLVTGSTLNVDDASAYAPLLDVGRAIRITTAVTDHGVAPVSGDWKEVFNGRIDAIDWESDPLTVRCSDLSAWLMDTAIQTATSYGSDSGASLESIIQAILADWPSGAGPSVTLKLLNSSGVATAVGGGGALSPSWTIPKAYTQQPMPVLQAINNLVAQIGWTIRYHYDTAGTLAFTLYEPPRSSTTSLATIGPSVYREVRKCDVDVANVRNSFALVYKDTSNVAQTRTTTDSTSITRYGTRFMQLAGDPVANIRTSTDADTMLAAIKADLAYPKLDQDVTLLYYWPAQAGDLYTFSQNGVHYDTDQKLAVIGVSHTAANGEILTTLQTRGTIIGAYADWTAKRVTSTEVITTSPGSSLITVGWTDVTGKPTTLSGYGVLTEADARYLQLTGGTLTGDLTVRGSTAFDTAGQQATLYLGNANSYVRSTYDSGLTFSPSATSGSAMTLSTAGQLSVATALISASSRPIDLGVTSGAIRIKGDSGGWDIGTFFLGSGGTNRGGFGALGSADALSYLYVGTDHSNYFATWTSALMTLSGGLTAVGVATAAGFIDTSDFQFRTSGGGQLYSYNAAASAYQTMTYDASSHRFNISGGGTSALYLTASVATFGGLAMSGVTTLGLSNTLTNTLGTLTASTPAFSSTATWNNSGVTFVHQFANVTDTASASGSLLTDWQLSGTSVFQIRKTPALLMNDVGTYAALVGFTAQAGSLLTYANTNGLVVARAGGSTNMNMYVASGSKSSPTALTSGTGGALRFGGFDGTTTRVAAQVTMQSTQNFTSTAAGAQIVFSVTANNTIGLTTALTLDQDKSATFYGAVSGVTTLTTSGAINGQTISSAASFTGTLAVANVISVSRTVASVGQVVFHQLIADGLNTGDMLLAEYLSNSGSTSVAKFGVRYASGQSFFTWRGLYDSGVGTAEQMYLSVSGLGLTGNQQSALAVTSTATGTYGGMNINHSKSGGKPIINWQINGASDAQLWYDGTYFQTSKAMKSPDFVLQ